MFIYPNWTAPSSVKAATTTRTGGVSQAPFDTFNLGLNTEDNRAQVLENRAILKRALNLPSEPLWLSQVHGADVLEITPETPLSVSPGVDATWTQSPGLVCAVTTADCLPVLLCDVRGKWVAAVHAGWRGLLGGVIPATCQAIQAQSLFDVTQVLAWFGPAIGPAAFEVGEEVYEQFVSVPQLDYRAAFTKNQGRWHANMYTLATIQLQALGITAIFGEENCTFSKRDQFFSYRRDGITGRMANLIWLS